MATGITQPKRDMDLSPRSRLCSVSLFLDVSSRNGAPRWSPRNLPALASPEAVLSCLSGVCPQRVSGGGPGMLRHEDGIAKLLNEGWAYLEKGVALFAVGSKGH